MNGEWKVNYKDEILDSGRTLRVTVSMGAEATKGEVEIVLADLGRTAPPKGFRPGKARLPMLRRLHGPRAVEHARTNLVAKSRGVVLATLAKKYGFDPELDPLLDPAASGVKFSEKDGLSFELVFSGHVDGQFVAPAPPPPPPSPINLDKVIAGLQSGGSVIDLRTKKEES